MNLAFWQYIDRFSRQLTPFALTLLLVILSVVPLRIPGYAQIAPVLAIVSIFHWSLYRPHLLPPIAVFGLGLLQDLLSGSPPGLHILVFLSVHAVVLTQRRFLVGKSFPVYWFGFGLIGLGAAIEMWVLGSVWNFVILDFRIMLFQYVLTFGLFPPVAWFFLRWQQAFLQQD